MKSKSLVRLLVAIVVAVVGAWQYHAENQKRPPAESREQSQQHRKNQGSSNNAGQQVGDFDYYLISLSWSPSYCATHPQDQTQCGGRGYGFILHGLWPQKSTGGYPQDCAVNSQPSAATVDKAMAFMPSKKLIKHEWDKHGTCSGLTPEQYFDLADKAFAAVKIPALFQTPAINQELNAQQIIAAFTKENPRFSEQHFALKCSKGEFEEVRVCVDTALNPRDCGKGVRSQCGKGDTIFVRSMR